MFGNYAQKHKQNRTNFFCPGNAKGGGKESESYLEKRKRKEKNPDYMEAQELTRCQRSLQRSLGHRTRVL
jgi:hypothetical protein